MPLLLLFALFLLLRGHNAPGGGFVGGLVVSRPRSCCIRSHTASPASRRALLVDPSTLLSVGLLVALISGLPAILLGRPFMTAVWTTVWHGTGRRLHSAHRLLFDVGVFLAVIGVVLTIVFTLGDVALTED